MDNPVKKEKLKSVVSNPHPIRPSDSQWLVKFMSSLEFNRQNKQLLIKAIKAYTRKCSKAAKELEADLNKIIEVKINK